MDSIKTFAKTVHAYSILVFVNFSMQEKKKVETNTT